MKLNCRRLILSANTLEVMRGLHLTVLSVYITTIFTVCKYHRYKADKPTLITRIFKWLLNYLSTIVGLNFQERLTAIY